MVSPNQALPPEMTGRLSASVQRILASLGGEATVSFREARGAEIVRSLPGPLVALTCRFV
jgi:hypothetical protein